MIDENITMNDQETPFDVTEPTEIGNLSDVQEFQVIPPAQRVKVVINKVTNAPNKAQTFKQLNVSFKLLDGIDEVGKFKGAVVFERITYWADKEAYPGEFFTSRRYLGTLKRLLRALGISLEKVIINDDLMKQLEGKELLVDISQKPNKFTAKDGTKVSNFVNVIKNFRTLSIESQV